MSRPILPTVFIAFANDLDDHLVTLKKESRDIYNALAPLDNQGAIAIHREESIEVDELYQDLLSFNDRLVIFHYAGHADGSMLQFEGGVGSSKGIAGLLGQQPSLKLVFLNGCATKDQVNALHQAGVPAVIATAVKINDTKATLLSHAFYQALADGQSIFDAFDNAKHYIETKFDSSHSVMPSISRQPNSFFAEQAQDSAQSLEFEWGLYTLPEAEEDLTQWRLTSARQNWQIQLEDTQGKIKDRDGKPILIERHQPIRNIVVKTCLSCGIHYYLTEKSDGVCPACSSAKHLDKPLQVMMAEQQSAFIIERDNALALAKKALGGEDKNQIQLSPIYLPYWVFDIDVYIDVSAKIGVIKDPHAQSMALEWESVSTTFSQQYKEVLLPGFTQPDSSYDLTSAQNPPNWQLDAESMTPLTQLDIANSFVPLDVTVENAFFALSSHIDVQVSAQIPEEIGGVQQTNIKAQRTYENINVISVMLPHWYACIKSEKGSAHLLINGHSGDIQLSQEAGQSVFSHQSNAIMNKQKQADSIPTSQSSNLVSIFSGGGIGIMIGLLMGLAAPQGDDAKSIVAIFIGAVGVGLAALLGLNDRHFSMAKGLRIGSFGISVAIFALVGIYIRTNAPLSPSIVERATELKTVFPNMSDAQLMELLSVKKQVYDKETGEVIQTNISLEKATDALFASDEVKSSACSDLEGSNDANVEMKYLLKRFQRVDGAEELGWKSLASEIELHFDSGEARAILLLTRDAACGLPPWINPVKPSKSLCTKLQQGNVDYTSLKVTNPNLNSVIEKVASVVPQTKQETALKRILPVLCTATISKN